MTSELKAGAGVLSRPVLKDLPDTTEYRRRSRRLGSSVLAHGEPLLWLTGGALVLCLLMIGGLLALVLYKGIGTFWPQPLVLVDTSAGQKHLGEVTNSEWFRPSDEIFEEIPESVRATARESVRAAEGLARRRLFRTGNFELSGTHFVWLTDFDVTEEARPEWAITVERQAWGRFYGFYTGFATDGELAAGSPRETWEKFLEYHESVRDNWKERRRLETDEIGEVSRRLKQGQLAMRTAELRHGVQSDAWKAAERRYRGLETWSEAEYARIGERVNEINAENARFELVLTTASGQESRLALADIVRAYPANQLALAGALKVYLARWWEFLSAEPREANSEGGVFPAIFGTVLMTLLMSIAVVPYGVLAALYLREYAKAGVAVSAVRIAINNLAGVPSIVFGVFGLGFFCYGVGSFIDAGPDHPWTRSAWYAALVVLAGALIAAILLGFLSAARPGTESRAQRIGGRLGVVCWLAAVALAVLLIAKTPFFSGFYEASLPNPTFGKGALIWASLTLALLTLPVVIVSTEEALAAVPNSMREGSYACGASKWQTIRRIVLPRAMPGIMTGMILAMARGAGEVAPLMLVGAVKLAPELPIALEPPFGINRSFMHLGFHIYDLGFQSQNSEAAKPMVYTTTLLLILIIAALNLFAIWLRSRLRRKYVESKF